MKVKEKDLQIAVAKYMALQYPKILWCHIPNGFYGGMKQGMAMKRQGLRPGMPDVMIFEPAWEYFKSHTESSHYYGLAVELKVNKGRLQESQKIVLKQLEEAGWKTEVCYSFDEAKEIIDKYLL